MQKNEGGSQLILIVDDVSRNLQVLGVVLKKEGHRVAVAQSGEQALEYVSKHQPDLILLDIMMPTMNGYDVCKKLKENQKTKNIPVIFITALSEVDDEYHGFEVGGVDYITKPFSSKIVNARVKTHLRLKKKTDLLETLSNIDGLTDIPNRRKFDDVLKNEWTRAMRGAYPISLIMVDIDFFKKYNDCYGHAAGDKCLQRIASCLFNTVHRPADLFARYGGEEFAGLLPETTIENALQIAEKMRVNIESLNIPHEQNTYGNQVTISIGVASIIPNNNTSPVALIREADKRLYESKENGRNQVSASQTTPIQKV